MSLNNIYSNIVDNVLKRFISESWNNVFSNPSLVERQCIYNYLIQNNFQNNTYGALYTMASDIMEHKALKHNQLQYDRNAFEVAFSQNVAELLTNFVALMYVNMVQMNQIPMSQNAHQNMVALAQSFNSSMSQIKANMAQMQNNMNMGTVMNNMPNVQQGYANGSNNTVPGGLSTTSYAPQTMDMGNNNLRNIFENNPNRVAAMNRPAPVQTVNSTYQPNVVPEENWMGNNNQQQNKPVTGGHIEMSTNGIGIGMYIPDEPVQDKTVVSNPPFDAPKSHLANVNFGQTEVVTSVEEITDGLMEDLNPNIPNIPSAPIAPMAAQAPQMPVEPAVVQTGNPFQDSASLGFYENGEVFMNKDVNRPLVVQAKDVNEALNITPIAFGEDDYLNALGENISGIGPFSSGEQHLVKAVTNVGSSLMPELTKPPVIEKVVEVEEVHEEPASIEQADEFRAKPDLQEALDAHRLKMAEQKRQRQEDRLAAIAYSTKESTAGYKRVEIGDIWEAADASEFKTLVDQDDGVSELVFAKMSEEDKVKYEDHIIPNTAVTKQVFGQVMSLNRDGDLVVDIPEVVNTLELNEDEFHDQAQDIMSVEVPVLNPTSTEFVESTAAIPAVVISEVVSSLVDENMDTTPDAVLVELFVADRTVVLDGAVDKLDLHSELKTKTTMEEFKKYMNSLLQEQQFALVKSLTKRLNYRFNRLLVSMGLGNIFVKDAMAEYDDLVKHLNEEIGRDMVTDLESGLYYKVFRWLAGEDSTSNVPRGQTDPYFLNENVSALYVDNLLHELNLTAPSDEDSIAEHGWFEVTEEHHSVMYKMCRALLMQVENKSQGRNNSVIVTRDAAMIEIQPSFDLNDHRVYLRAVV